MQVLDIFLKAIAFNGFPLMNLFNIYCVCYVFHHINHLFWCNFSTDSFAMLFIGAVLTCAQSSL